MITYYSYRLFTVLAFLALAGIIYRQFPSAETSLPRIAIFIPAVHPAMDAAPHAKGSARSPPALLEQAR